VEIDDRLIGEEAIVSDLTHLNPTGRFTGLAELYARCRPGYPAEALDFIMAQGKLTAGSVVADVGCGTGISTRLLAARGLRVIGIEPNAEMRREAAATLLQPAMPQPVYRDGQAEQTGLPSASCAAVVSAQAFHWFRHDEALREFHRILKPTGWLFLIWNERDNNDSFTGAYGGIVRQGPNADEVESRRSGEVLLTHPAFCAAQFKVFANAQELDADGLLGRAFSISYAPREPAAAEKFKTDLLDLFRRYEQAGRVILRYQTLLYFARPVDSNL